MWRLMTEIRVVGILVFPSLFLDPFPAQTRVAITDTGQATKNRTTTRTSGPTMMRLATEALIVIATWPLLVKGSSMTVATSMVIVEVVRRGNTSTRGMYIRRCGAEGTLVPMKKEDQRNRAQGQPFQKCQFLLTFCG